MKIRNNRETFFRTIKIFLFFSCFDCRAVCVKLFYVYYAEGDIYIDSY